MRTRPVCSPISTRCGTRSSPIWPAQAFIHGPRRAYGGALTNCIVWNNGNSPIVGDATVTYSDVVKSQGKIAKGFLLGCGMPAGWVEYYPALIGMLGPIQFHSCFISHSTDDKTLCERLYQALQKNNVTVYYAPEDLKGGDWFDTQLEQAIDVHDKLLLVLSESSMTSQWVENEIRWAFAKEKKTNARVLFPIRICDWKTVSEWECLDTDTGVNLARKVRRYNILDFTEDELTFDEALARLIKDLQADLAFGSLDKLTKFRALGFEAEIREVLAETRASLRQLQTLASISATTILSTVQMTGRVGGFRDEQKEDIKNQVMQTLAELGVPEHQQQQALTWWHKCVEFDYALCIVQGAKVPSPALEASQATWNRYKGKSVLGRPTPRQIRSLLEEHDLLTATLDERLKDYEFYCSERKHRRPEEWSRREEWRRPS